MSILSSHAAFAYRLADSQCHNNNEPKRLRARSLFPFHCNKDEKRMGVRGQERRASSGSPGCVNPNHRNPDDDQPDLMPKRRLLRADPNSIDVMDKQSSSGVSSAGTSDPHVTPHADRRSTAQSVLQDVAMTQRQGSDFREYLFKVLVIGDLGTGKTSFIKRYVHQFFSTHYRATIGVDFALKVIKWSKNSVVRVQLWDIAGQERFGQMTRVYYKEAAGAIIVFDVSSPKSFEAVLKWKADLDQKVSCPDGSPIPTLLLANKCDESKAGSLGEETFLNQFCQENGFIGWFYTSPKENVNIGEAANFLIRGIFSRRRRSSALSDGHQDDDMGHSMDETRNYRQGFSLTSRLKENSSNCCS